MVVIGGVHGNEPAGWRAARWIRHWEIDRGRLIVLPAANLLGLAKNTRRVPTRPTFDLNRQFPSKAGARVSKPLPASLWRFLSKFRPDWVVDLHESVDYRYRATREKNYLGHSLICHRDEETLRLAKAMVEAANTSTPAGKRQWVVLRHPIEGSLVRAAATRLDAHAIIAETCRKDYLAVRVRHHRLLVHRLLRELSMLPEGQTANLVFPVPREEGRIRVAAYNSTGTGSSSAYAVERCLPESRGFLVRRVTAADVREGILGQFDVVVFPGGTGSGTAKALGKEGRAEVREFVRGGGGFLGICAGAYLASAHYGWSLGLIDAGVVDTKHWARGKGGAKVEVTESGRGLLGSRSPVVVYYGQGPLLAPAGRDDLPDYETLAVYRSEIAKGGAPRGVMIGTTAAARAGHGEGRVVVFSPHPEKSRGLGAWVRSSVRWLAGR